MEGYGENVVLITIGRGPPNTLIFKAIWQNHPRGGQGQQKQNSRRKSAFLFPSVPKLFPEFPSDPIRPVPELFPNDVSDLISMVIMIRI
jgi:hypothetical protein